MLSCKKELMYLDVIAEATPYFHEENSRRMIEEGLKTVKLLVPCQQLPIATLQIR